MASFTNTLPSSLWPETVQRAQALSTRLRSKLLGDARSELAASISDHLIVFKKTLFHLESGESAALSGVSDEDKVSASLLARNAARLLKQASDANGSSQAKGNGKRSIKLFLPPSEFLGTSQAMPGISGDNLIAALSLQIESVLPANEQELALATTTTLQRNTDTVTALWFPQQRLAELFEAFSENELLLAVVQPRVFCTSVEEGTFSLIDDDEEELTALSWENGTAVNWLQCKKTDLEQEAFNAQWQETVGQLTNVSVIEGQKPQHYLDAKLASSVDYCFFPPGAIAERKKVEKSRQMVIAASLFAAVLAVAALPFLLQSLEFRMAQSQLEAAREMSSDAREDQRIVVDFENEWGTLNDFPDQQVRQAMFQLQEVLAGEQLSSLELSEGLIRIQGTSSDPQAILQRLEQDPMFTEVVFSRATNNTRYYIDLRLAAVNFEAYMLRYFPEDS